LESAKSCRDRKPLVKTSGASYLKVINCPFYIILQGF
jgi:hypothetical protein